MALLTLRDITVAFDDPPLIDRANLNVERGERICLIGRNGTGKSTLLKCIAGEFHHDSGEIARERGAVFSYLPQEVPEELSGTVFDVVAAGLGERGELLSEYHAASAGIAESRSADAMSRLEELEHRLELSNGWQAHREAEMVISHMRLSPDARCEELSAGTRRRVLMARALAAKPDLLMLDEPTNHLDIETIAWLEEYLREAASALLFVTHDREFLRHLATRIVEIDRGSLRSWACGYDAFIERREAFLEAEEKQRAQFEKKLAEEEAWLRKGVRARRTRNEGRVRALLSLREERRAQRDRIGSVDMIAQEAARSGKLVIEAKGIFFEYPGIPIAKNFSTTISRGDKVGIIGPNGSGKTTLMRLLLGEIAPLSGSVRHGTNIEIAYFDQLRAGLDGEKSVADNICDGSPFLTIDGQRRHVLGYLEDFLFDPARARTPVSALSGGERNRLMLAKLFALPSNLLVLDEPTNDLDAETLELLEDMLVEYGGTLIMVSHDRAFLNNVVTSTLAIEGNGRIGEYIGGYDDWLRSRPAPAGKADAQPKQRTEQKRDEEKKQPQKKLSFKENRELNELPGRIEALEREKESLLASMSSPEVYSKAGGVADASARIAKIEEELSFAYDRWAELEERRGGS